MVGVYWRAVWQGDVPPLAWEYAAVSVPVAVTMAPLEILQGTIIIVMSFGFFTSIAKVGQALIDDSDEQQMEYGNN
ncbi:hypothetical protein ANCDUO_20449 [Ancylostoma duodenale]|uniref:Uncharacterized protein n=1 Tax=Ancylostoma duodenale TaxID=51022 RepID=A0A0C2FX67_9BILA|nr:hypothetical protein ANCDUO_20449 [Ancylostoma duodenale]